MDDGHWVCTGGTRVPGRLGCEFRTSKYVEAVNHATAHGAVPPDMPRDLWVTA